MHADMEAVLQLQERDEAVTAIEDELRGLEPEIERLDEELGQAQSELETARRGVEDAAVRRAELEGKITFLNIAEIVDEVLAAHRAISHPSIEDIIGADEWARYTARSHDKAD